MLLNVINVLERSKHDLKTNKLKIFWKKKCFTLNFPNAYEFIYFILVHSIMIIIYKYKIEGKPEKERPRTPFMKQVIEGTRI